MATSKSTKYRLMKNPNLKCRIPCSAYGCDMKGGTNALSEIKMYHFPRNPLRKRRWELATRRANWKANNSSRLCSKHFITGKPSKDPKHPDYIPSIFVFNRNAQNLKNQNAKSKIHGEVSNTIATGQQGTFITSTCGIKGYCSKCFSSESVSSAFSQSLAPVHQTLEELMIKLNNMEEEREQLRNELALCREEIYQLHEAHQHCSPNPQPTSRHSKTNSPVSVPSTTTTTTTVGVSDILQSMYSDEPSDAYDADVLPSRYLEQIYHQTDEPSKRKRQKNQPKESDSDEDLDISDECPSPKKKRVKRSILKSKGTNESSSKDGKSPDTSSPITIVYLKR